MRKLWLISTVIILVGILGLVPTGKSPKKLMPPPKHKTVQVVNPIPEMEPLKDQLKAMKVQSSRNMSLQQAAKPKPKPQPVQHDWITFTATWYSSDGGINGNGRITATGTQPVDNWTIAVDPAVIPYGSLIVVRFKDGSEQEYQAQDTGSAIVGNRLDIYYHDENYCLDHGIQPVQLYIKREGY